MVVHVLKLSVTFLEESMYNPQEEEEVELPEPWTDRPEYGEDGEPSE